jgi:hypothetical protein
MIRSLKALGLVVIAALALGAMLDSVAPANTGTGVFTCGKTPNTHTSCTLHGGLTGAENFFEAAGQKTTCENQGVTYTSAATGTNNDFTLTAHFKDCAQEGLPVTVNMNGCTVTTTQPTTTGVGSQYDGTADIVCPAGQTVDIETFLFGTPTGSHSVNVCTIKVLPKNGLTNTTAVAGTSGGKDAIAVNVNVTNLKYERSGSCGAASGENARLVGALTWTAKSLAGEPEDVWLSD